MHLKKIPKNQQQGMTLIELMLAMVVTASVILYFSVSVKNNTQERQLQQTSIEMQTILQAAASYYSLQQNIFYSTIAKQNIISDLADSNLVSGLAGYSNQNADIVAMSFWPENTSDLLGSCPTNSDSLSSSPCNAFLNTQWQLCSSWEYSPSSGGTPCPIDNDKAGYSISRSANYLEVSIVMPSKNLAKKLAAKLPGGMVYPWDDNELKVVSYIPRPSGRYYPPMLLQKCDANNNSNCNSANEVVGARGWIASGGVLSASNNDPVSLFGITNATKARTIVLPNCPAGYEGHYILSFLRAQTGDCVSYFDYAKRPFFSLERPMYWNMMVYPQSYSGNSIKMSNNMGTFFEYAPSVNAVPIIGLDACFPIPITLASLIQKSLQLADTGYMVQYFITMCVPNKHWFVHLDPGNEQLCNKNEFLSENRAGYVTQCQNNWSKYNKATNTSQCPVATEGC